MRAHREVPRDGQQKQLGEHCQPPAPSPADHQRSSSGEHPAADHNEPDRSPQAVHYALVGSGEPAHHQHRGDHQRGRALHRDDEARATNGSRRRRRRHSVSVITLTGGTAGY